MDLRLPYIKVSIKSTSEAELYLREWKDDVYVGIIDFSTRTVIIDNLYCDRFDKYEICLAIADDPILHYYLGLHGEFRDYFDKLYRFSFKAEGTYEVRLMGSDFPIEVYNDEREADNRASYFTETDPDGDKYEVIVRGNPYEQYN